MATEAAAEVLEIDLGDELAWRLGGWRKVDAWLEAVDKAWNWVRTETVRNDPANARGNLTSRLDQLKNEAAGLQARGASVQELAPVVHRIFSDSYGPFHPESDAGATILDIFDKEGAEAALFGFSFLRRHVGIGHVQTPDHLAGLMIAAYPPLASVSASGDRLATERANFRTAARRLGQEVDEAERQRKLKWAELLDESGTTSTAWAQRRARRWLRYVLHWRKEKRASIESIQAVEKAYREAMSLQAPVEYWQRKASQHQAAEDRARDRLLWYFPLAFLLISTMFGGAAYVLLTTPEPNLAPGLYFVASAGLASAAGILFWVGRLLTKLYLSEHHLRHDAEERATMTTTYLALTAEKAAAEDDRQIILNALFRSTPDGIVREEGGLDPSLAAALGRLLAGRS